MRVPAGQFPAREEEGYMTGARSRSPVSLTPPNRGAIWANLALSKSQLAKLCGVTPRQVAHWASRGYLVAAGQDPQRFNGNAIDMCLLIKQGLDQDLPLHRAVAQARAFINDELLRQPVVKVIEPPSLIDMLEKLRGAGASIEAVIQVVEPLALRAGPDEVAGK
jgi:hypothetical protein